MPYDELYDYVCNESWLHTLREWIDAHRAEIPARTWYNITTEVFIAPPGIPISVYWVPYAGYWAGDLYVRKTYPADSLIYYSDFTWGSGSIPEEFGTVIGSGIQPRCGNWTLYILDQPDQTRSQTTYLRAALSGPAEKAGGIITTIATLPELPDGITATIQADIELPIVVQAAIQGNIDRPVGIRAAIRDEPELAPGITAAAAKTDELADGLTATIQSDVQLNPWIRTAILGETQLEVSIATFIVVSRKDTIRLEMENLGPQEFAHRAVPNWASRVKDYRTDSLGS